MKYSEKWGDSIDAAVELALQDLKLTRDQVTVTVLEQPSKGFFGLGSKLAKVRVEEIVKEPVKPVKSEKVKESPAKAPRQNKPEKTENREKKPAKKNKPAEAPVSEIKADAEKIAEEVKEASVKPEKNRNRQKKKKTVAAPIADFKIEAEVIKITERPADLQEVEDHPAKTFLESVFKDMELDVTVKVAVDKDNVYADIDGKDTGTVIGKRGQTLDSLQYLTSLVVNKGEDEYIRVVVDAEGYRAKREETLEKLAYRLAEKAVKTGSKVRLEPMNPYERKVIHTTLQSVPAVFTRSEGEEPFRRVVIEPAKN